MKYDLIVSDFDGTLGKAPDIIASETVVAIKEYCKKGGVFAVCSGRMMASILPICRKYGFSGAVAAYQGAMINDIESGENLFSGGIDGRSAVKFTEDLIRYGLTVVLDIDDVMYYNKPNEIITAYEYASKVKGIEEPKIIDLLLKTDRPVQKILGLKNPAEIPYYTEIFRKKYGDRLIVNSGAPTLVEAVSPSCSKRVAVEFIAKHYGVPLDKVIAVGDSTNDIELMRGSWHAVAVGDGNEELKAIADEVTVPFQEQPVKFLLEKYCL